jgi:hypothetical protein
VKTVTKNDLTSRSIRESSRSLLENDSTKADSCSVDSVAKNDLQAYFSTLSTEMKSRSVGKHGHLNRFAINDLCDFPQIPQVPQEKRDDPVVFLNRDEDSKQLVFEWMRVVLTEGHIEASQPSVGRIVGWPSRSFSIHSVFVDFDLWCRQHGVSRWSVPGESLFCAVLDEVLCREGDRYAFPPLDECRAKFVQLEANCEPA